MSAVQRSLGMYKKWLKNLVEASVESARGYSVGRKSDLLTRCSCHEHAGSSESFLDVDGRSLALRIGPRTQILP